MITAKQKQQYAKLDPGACRRLPPPRNPALVNFEKQCVWLPGTKAEPGRWMPRDYHECFLHTTREGCRADPFCGIYCNDCVPAALAATPRSKLIDRFYVAYRRQAALLHPEASLQDSELMRSFCSAACTPDACVPPCSRGKDGSCTFHGAVAKQGRFTDDTNIWSIFPYILRIVGHQLLTELSGYFLSSLLGETGTQIMEMVNGILTTMMEPLLNLSSWVVTPAKELFGSLGDPREGDSYMKALLELVYEYLPEDSETVRYAQDIISILASSIGYLTLNGFTKWLVGKIAGVFGAAKSLKRPHQKVRYYATVFAVFLLAALLIFVREVFTYSFTATKAETNDASGKVEIKLIDPRSGDWRTFHTQTEAEKWVTSNKSGMSSMFDKFRDVAGKLQIPELTKNLMYTTQAISKMKVVVTTLVDAWAVTSAVVKSATDPSADIRTLTTHTMRSAVQHYAAPDALRSFQFSFAYFKEGAKIAFAIASAASQMFSSLTIEKFLRKMGLPEEVTIDKHTPRQVRQRLWKFLYQTSRQRLLFSGMDDALDLPKRMLSAWNNLCAMLDEHDPEEVLAIVRTWQASAANDVWRQRWRDLYLAGKARLHLASQPTEGEQEASDELDAVMKSMNREEKTTPGLPQKKSRQPRRPAIRNDNIDIFY